MSTFATGRWHSSRRRGSHARFDAIKPSFTRFLAWTPQGLWVFLTLAAALGAMTSAQRGPLGLVGFVDLAVWTVGFAIEVVSDRQKRTFRQDPANSGRFITTGLWVWARHPICFGEVVLWLGIPLIALPSLSGWQYVTLISPLFVFLLITRVSGLGWRPFSRHTSIKMAPPSHRLYECRSTVAAAPVRPAFAADRWGTRRSNAVRGRVDWIGSGRDISGMAGQYVHTPTMFRQHRGRAG